MKFSAEWSDTPGRKMRDTGVIYLIILIYIQTKRTAHFRPILIRLTASDPLKIFAVWIMLCYLKIIKTRKMNTLANSAQNRLRLLI